MKSIQETLLDRNEIVKLHELPFIQSINCSVTLQLAAEDECLVTSGGQSEYACLLTQSAFKDMIELIKFSSDGHNWLTPGEYIDDPAFLISKWGPW
jgi:hypothetical protein